MPKKRPSSPLPQATDTYESDNGFVEDAPRSKRPKTTGTAQKQTRTQKSGVDMKAKAAGKRDGEGEVGKDGEVFWEVRFPLGFGVLGGRGGKGGWKRVVKERGEG